MESRPLVVQSDRTMLMDVHDPASSQCRDTIVPFSELVKSPEHLHTYQITRISLWNACSAGLGEDDVMSALARFSRYEIPETVEYFIRDTCRRYGVVRFTDDRFFLLECTSELYRRQVLSIPAVRDIIIDDGDIRVPMNRRGDMKVILIDHDFPVQDLIPLKKGRPLEIALREVGQGLPEGGLRRPVGGRCARSGIRHRRPSMRKRQDHSGARRHGTAEDKHSYTGAKRRIGAPVETRDSGQDYAGAG